MNFVVDIFQRIFIDTFSAIIQSHDILCGKYQCQVEKYVFTLKISLYFKLDKS